MNTDRHGRYENDYNAQSQVSKREFDTADSREYLTDNNNIYYEQLGVLLTSVVLIKYAKSVLSDWELTHSYWVELWTEYIG